jgi:hypothetical protein
VGDFKFGELAGVPHGWSLNLRSLLSIPSSMEEPEPDPFFYHQRKVLITAIALTALCTQLTTIMALPSASVEKEPKAKWNDTETTELVQYLWEHRAQGGDGGTFKPATFKAAAEHIAPYHTLGPVKTTKSVQIKWNGVSCSLSLH